MTILEELKKKWHTEQASVVVQAYDLQSLKEIVKSRVKKHTNTAMKYFWSSFVLQMIIYALLNHVIIKYWSDYEIIGIGILGIVLYIPFTIILMKKFKAIARTRITNHSGSSMYQYIYRRYSLLLSFYQFKRRYEFVLVPLSCIIGIYLIFKLYVPGGVQDHPIGAIIVFAISIISCFLSIRAENKRNFENPLYQLKDILEEFKSGNK